MSFISETCLSIGRHARFNSLVSKDIMTKLLCPGKMKWYFTAEYSDNSLIFLPNNILTTWKIFSKLSFITCRKPTIKLQCLVQMWFGENSWKFCELVREIWSMEISWENLKCKNFCQSFDPLEWGNGFAALKSLFSYFERKKNKWEP